MDLAKLILTADASGLKQGERALDSLAAKGEQTEKRVTTALDNTGKKAKETGGKLVDLGKEADKAKRPVDQLGKEIDDLGGKARKAKPPLTELPEKIDNAGKQAANANARIQQFGWQLGQVTQQGAVTGNYLQALAVQMGDILPMLGIGGAAGVAVMGAAILAPMATAFLGGKDAADAMADALEDLNDKIDEYKRFAELANASSQELRDRFGDLSDSARDLYEGMARLSEIEALRSLKTAGDELSAQFKQVRIDLEDIAEAEAQGASTTDLVRSLTDGLAENFGLTVDEATNLVALLDAMKSAGSLDEQAAAADALAAYLTDVAANGADVDDELVTSAKSASELALRVLEIASNSNAAADGVSGITANLAAARAEADALAYAIATLPGASLREMDDGRGSQREGMRDLAEWRTDEWLRKRREAEAKARRDAAAAARPKRGKKGATAKTDRPDEYERASTDILGDTQAFLAQADALAKVTAVGGDWEHALAVIEQEQNLLNAAQKAGIKVNENVRKDINEMAEAYVTAEENLEQMRNATEKGQDAMRDFFGSILDGADSAKDALVQLLEQIAKVQFAKGALGLLGGTSWGSAAIETVGNLLSFDGGGDTGNGQRIGGLDGKGGRIAIVHPQETIIDHTKGQSAGGGVLRVEVVPSPYFDAKVSEISDASAARAAGAVRNGVPDQIRQYQLNPRKK